ncbi:hypothetical protein ACQ5SK_24810 [Bradyrhizobium japonicum]
MSTTALTARPNVLNDFDIDVSSPLGPYGAKGGGHSSFAFSNWQARHATARWRYIASISAA